MSGSTVSRDKKALDIAKERLETLKKLHKESIITDAEFTDRRDQIINELTGTTGHSVSQRRVSAAASTAVSNVRFGSLVEGYDGRIGSPVKWERKQKPLGLTQIKKHPPPDWSKPIYPVEKAVKITYDFSSRQWKREDTKVKIEMKPFDKGGLRLVFHLKDLNNPDTAFVAKMSRDPRDNNNIYFEDVRMQAVAAYFAERFNKYNPPKKIKFLTAFIMELKDRVGSPVCGVERFIKGHYRKYNNNSGWISEDERNTPLAFCHFTWEASNGGLLICDIQGVEDVYTDPQIHSREGEGFGKGNLGVEGMNKFLQTHKCNPICKFLGLPNVNRLPIEKFGTVPFKTRMNQEQITQLKGITLMSEPLLGYQYCFPELKQNQSYFCACDIL